MDTENEILKGKKIDNEYKKPRLTMQNRGYTLKNTI